MSQQREPVLLLDWEFNGHGYSALFQESFHMRWIRGTRLHRYLKPFVPPFFRFLSKSKLSKVLVVTDRELRTPRMQGKRHVAWILEPPCLAPFPYDFTTKHASKFDVVLTYNAELLKLGGPFQFYPCGGCWIKPEDWSVYSKSRCASIIASEKRDTDGHQLRHRIIQESCLDDLAICGRGYQPIPYKLEALRDFMFSFVIENSRFDYYFTEKLIDCLVTGTVRVYYGCPSIGKFFNTDGFLILSDIADLEHVESRMTVEVYNAMLPAIQENFVLAQKYALAEDWIFENTDAFTAQGR